MDIETIGENFDEMDKTTQETLTRWIKRESKNEEEYEVALKDLKDGLGFSPWTGEIVALGVMDCATEKAVVCFQASQKDYGTFEENGVTYKQMSEKAMLENFWRGVEKYDELITFNGRGFDVPYIMIRSAVHEIRPSKDFMRGRYVSQHAPGARHIDLQDQIIFYGAVRRRPSLHLCCRTLGIKSPKEDGVTGDDVAQLYAEKKYKDIARYNVRDLVATKELYDYWHEYLQF